MYGVLENGISIIGINVILSYGSKLGTNLWKYANLGICEYLQKLVIETKNCYSVEIHTKVRLAIEILK